jgi:heat shock protein HslJ
MALGAICALAISACAGILPTQPAGPIEGDWLLMRADGLETSLPVADAGVSLVIDGDSATGFGGCGKYAFSLTGDTAHLRFGEPAPGTLRSGRLFCAPDLEDAQAHYIGALRSSFLAVLTDHHLRLLGDKTMLLFRPAPPPPRLTGTSWVLESHGDTWQTQQSTRVVGDTTLSFVGANQFVARLACGQVVGFYQVARSKIEVVSYARRGLHWCPVNALVDDLKVGDLLNGFRAEIDGDRLILTRNRLEVAFRAAEPRLEALP